MHVRYCIRNCGHLKLSQSDRPVTSLSVGHFIQHSLIFQPHVGAKLLSCVHAPQELTWKMHYVLAHIRTWKCCGAYRLTLLTDFGFAPEIMSASWTYKSASWFLALHRCCQFNHLTARDRDQRQPSAAVHIKEKIREALYMHASRVAGSRLQCMRKVGSAVTVISIPCRAPPVCASPGWPPCAEIMSSKNNAEAVWGSTHAFIRRWSQCLNPIQQQPHYGRKRLFTRTVTWRLHSVYHNYKHYTVKSVNVW
jgi:hypothetical protein